MTDFMEGSFANGNVQARAGPTIKEKQKGENQASPAKAR
jgi:hypothetical protein